MPKNSEFSPARVSATTSKGWRTFVRVLVRRCGRALLEWLAHSILLFGILACIQALHVGVLAIGISPNKRFFGRIPLEWLFDAADFAVLVGIGVIGLVAAVRSYLGKH